MDWDRIQAEHAEWLSREFPRQPIIVPLAGCVEEAGELVHCLLKLQQERIWGEDPRYPNLKDDFIDAVGDCGIYAVSLCNAVGWRFGRIVEMHTNVPAVAADVLVPACSAVDVAARGVRLGGMTEADLGEYLTHVDSVARAYGTTLSLCVERTWREVVSKRSRLKPARPRVVCLCGSTRFKEDFIRANFEETLAGRVVLSVGFFTHADALTFELTEQGKLALDELHKRKVEMSDEVLVVDPPTNVCYSCGKPCQLHVDDVGSVSDCCGSDYCVRPYIGESTASEIAHAVALRKPVRYRSKEHTGAPVTSPV